MEVNGQSGSLVVQPIILQNSSQLNQKRNVMQMAAELLIKHISNELHGDNNMKFDIFIWKNDINPCIQRAPPLKVT
jgi:hypothetical protein